MGSARPATEAEEAARNVFEIPDEVTYLNGASLAPRLKSVSAAGRAALDRMAAPWTIRSADWFSDAKTLASTFASIIGAPPTCATTSAKVSYTNSVAEETFLIPFGTSRLRLFLRHLPPSQHATNNKKVILFVHGASFPSGLAAAFHFGGHSWMEELSTAGFDSWALDFMGYGGSDRYPQMSDSNTIGAPLLRTEEAAEQIEVATRFIRDKEKVERVSIIAHSWGTLPSGLFATRQPSLLDRLVLFGAVTLRHGQPQEDATTETAPAWNVTVDAQRERFYGFVPLGEKPVLDASDMALWGPAYLASDPSSASRTPPSVRVPSGPLADSDLAWSGNFPYDPDKIRIPELSY